MANLKTNIDKEHFLTLQDSEQKYIIYSAVQGHEDRITINEENIAALQKKSWLRGSLTFLIGVITGFGGKTGLG